MTERLAWVLAVPLIALATLAAATYTAAMTAAETIVDFDLDDEFP